MRNSWIRVVGVLTAVVLPFTARGADHADGTPANLFLGTDTSSDITDIFAWTSTDMTKLNLVMDVAPGAMTGTKFSNVVKYVFHTGSQATFALGSPNPAGKVDVICTFDNAATQHISCWVIKSGMTLDYVTGDASATAGITSVSGKVKVFAGLRDDPFFFNLAGFKKTTQSAARAAGGLTFDAHGCPAGAAAVAGTLNKDCAGTGTAQDFFAPRAANDNAGCTDPTIQNHGTTGNILAIVIQIDKSLVNQGGKIVGVWGATTH